MLLFYIDECGDTAPLEHRHGGHGSPSQVFILAAVGIHDSSREALGHEILGIKRHYFPASVGSPDWNLSEIKGRFLTHSSRLRGHERARFLPEGWRELDDPEVMERFLNDVGQLFAKFRPLIFAALVDKRAMALTGEDTDPLAIAYTRLYERVALTLDQVNRGEGALFVADQQDEHEAYFRSGAMYAARTALEKREHNRPHFEPVLDKPLWIDSHFGTLDRELIQLADIVAYSVNEWYERGEPPMEHQYLWRSIAPCFAAHWKPQKSHGAGVMVYPELEAYPPLDPVAEM
ncbi:DUF3800 domain-containing protein [Demequina capsici]|uniref:DUF3800 domain-containing protein n=1 Tax=Demequina capsici TaxID=3075620 RepID=A0AA96FBP3_9MICO|nr:DUF3800 domain-containing protein [Demequina sp. PMTSA13]WNM26768.1 DUF3800 domain-containing protein [Demequina sp. PMTSA13]